MSEASGPEKSYGAADNAGGSVQDIPLRFAPLTFVSVGLDLPAQFPTVVLQELDSPFRMVRIPIGMSEGVAIAYAAKNITSPRPLTHDLMLSVFEAFRIDIVTLRITEYIEGRFFGDLVVSSADSQRSVACRVSDGIALCLRQRPSVPITASPSVIDQIGTLA